MVAFRTLVFSSLASLCMNVANATPNSKSPLFPRQNVTEPICRYSQGAGIYEPANNAVIDQDTSDYGCTNITIVYCSSQYFKTSTIDTSVWLSFPETTNTGELLAKDVAPNNLDSDGILSSYRYNVTVCPEDGDYPTGARVLSVYETETGYYNAYNFDITSINVTFTTSGSSS